MRWILALAVLCMAGCNAPPAPGQPTEQAEPTPDEPSLPDSTASPRDEPVVGLHWASVVPAGNLAIRLRSPGNCTVAASSSVMLDAAAPLVYRIEKADGSLSSAGALFPLAPQAGAAGVSTADHTGAEPAQIGLANRTLGPGENVAIGFRNLAASERAPNVVLDATCSEPPEVQASRQALVLSPPAFRNGTAQASVPLAASANLQTSLRQRFDSAAALWIGTNLAYIRLTVSNETTTHTLSFPVPGDPWIGPYGAGDYTLTLDRVSVPAPVDMMIGLMAAYQPVASADSLAQLPA